jgi:predicted amidohydrolase YtcJ
MLLRTWIFILIAGIIFTACNERSEDLSPADLVVLNANILTVDDNFSTAQAFAIRDELFIAVGSDDDIQKYIGDQTRVIDADGKTVVPGLIESHVHATSVVQREYATPHPFEQLGSISEIQDWLRTEVERTDRENWIPLPRVDVTRIQEGRIPNRADLDEAAPDHPAVFTWQFANRQVQVLNTAALESAGIDQNTAEPEGCIIERDNAGNPTGVLENCSELTGDYLPTRDIPEDRYHDDLERLLHNYNKTGITSIFERGSNAAGFRTYQQLREQDRLPVRVAVTLTINSDGTVEGTEEVIRSLPVEFGEGDNWVQTGPLKLRIDGGILYGSAYMREPYGPDALDFYGFDDPDHHGTLLISPENIENMIRAGYNSGWQMSAHVTGDAGVDVVLDAVEAVQNDLQPDNPRFTLIHAYFANPETAERASRLGVGIDTQPAWFYKDGDALARILSEERMNEFIGLQTWQNGDAIVAINSDHMQGFDPDRSLNPYNPFLTMYTVISRQTEGGQVIGPDQQISREDALRMMTSDAAWFSFEEEKKGSIEVGKLGDFAILSDDFLNCEVEEIKEIRSLLTVVGGNVVYEEADF